MARTGCGCFELLLWWSGTAHAKAVVYATDLPPQLHLHLHLGAPKNVRPTYFVVVIVVVCLTSKIFFCYFIIYRYTLLLWWWWTLRSMPTIFQSKKHRLLFKEVSLSLKYVRHSGCKSGLLRVRSASASALLCCCCCCCCLSLCLWVMSVSHASCRTERLFWLAALSTCTLAWTAFLLGNPLPSLFFCFFVLGFWLGRLLTMPPS